MIKTKNKLKIRNCVCGYKAYSQRYLVIYGIISIKVECSRLNCWEGPTKSSERKAIEAWNRG